MKSTRRDFLRFAGAGLMATQIPAVIASDLPENKDQQEKTFPFQLGIASYTFRKFSLDEVIEMTNIVAIKKLALKSMHLPLESTAKEIQLATEKISLAGIDLFGAGVIYMKTVEEVDNAFNYASAAGLDTIIGVPSYSLLEYCSKKVEAFNINLAIHNHGPGDEVYPSPSSIYEKIKDLHPGMGLCVDIGHTLRIGQDPIEETAKYLDRVHDIHIKDEDKATAEGKPLEIGRGIIDIPGFMKMLIDKKYSKVVSFEYEKDENNPLPGLAESIGYVRGVVEVIT